MQGESSWLTLQSAAREYDIPVPTWRRWLREGRIGHSRLGGRLLVCRQEIEEWISRNFRPAAGSSPAARVSRTSCHVGVDPSSVLAALEQGEEGCSTSLP